MNLKDCTEIGYVCRFFSSHWKLNGCKLRVICLIVSYVHFLPGVVQWGKPSTDICFEESVAIHLFHYPFSKTRAFQSYSSHGFQYITKPWFKLCYKPIYLRGEKKKPMGKSLARVLQLRSWLEVWQLPETSEKNITYSHITPPFTTRKNKAIWG